MLDSLPPNSLTQEAIANDEELARAIIDAAGGKLPAAKSKNPALRQWTQEATLLAQLIMEMRSQTALLVKINSKEGAAAPKVVPVPMPETAYQRLMEQALLEQRLGRHDELVRRLLGDRAKK